MLVVRCISASTRHCNFSDCPNKDFNGRNLDENFLKKLGSNLASLRGACCKDCILTNMQQKLWNLNPYHLNIHCKTYSDSLLPSSVRWKGTKENILIYQYPGGLK